MGYFDKVESIYPSLTKSEKKIADYIKDNGENVVFMSIKQLTEDIKVGDATVVRFYKKVGYTGFQDLKMDLAKEDFSEKYDDSDNYIEKIALNYKEIIESTKSLVDSDKIKIFVEMIKKSKKIFFYGIGASGLAALEAEMTFFRAGLHTKAIIDSHFQAMNSAILDNNCMVIAFSLSGTTADIYDALEIAKQNGAYIVVITNYLLSPVGELADIIFTTSKKESLLEGGSLSAKISQLYIIDILCTAYSLTNKEKYLSVRSKSAMAILNKRKD